MRLLSDYYMSSFRRNNVKYICILLTSLFFATTFSKTHADNSQVVIQSKQNILKVVGKDKKDIKVTLIQSQIKETLASIKKIIGSATCANNQSCEAIAIGQKACGGPQDFLAYSTLNTDTTQLNALSRKHQNLNRKLNRLTRGMSDCLFLSAPVVSCQNRQCQKK